ncbi:unnamed protein product [Urochloa decumbens]|uniref:F-box domain-containing protein n=1 Tax=Urochloa decumbens TaxID=240449 RepID=A0ABC9C0F2_9POAL
MAPLPDLVDELVEEVLLRIPPDDPAALARAAIVSRRWCRVAAGRSFRRRFRERHRRAAPPVLGLLCNLADPDHGGGDDARASGFVATPSFRPACATAAGSSAFVPTSPFRPACATAAGSSGFVPTSSFRPPHAAAGPGWRVLDARHGRVLLANLAWEKGPAADSLVLWDPVTGDRLELPELPRHRETLPWTSWNATVLCADGFPSTGTCWKFPISYPFGKPSTGWIPLRWPPLQHHGHESPASSTGATGDDGVCDHIDCRRGPFLVALVGVNRGQVFGHVYSSEVGDWSRPTFCHPRAELDCMAHSALVGNAVYFKCEIELGIPFRTHEILKYDLSTHKMSMIHLPYDSGMGEMFGDSLPPGRCRDNGQHIVLMTMEDDAGLGFARVHDSKLHLWAREAGPDYGEWTLRRVIDLQKLIPTDALSISPELVGFVDGGEVFFVLTANGLFAINLRSGQARKNFNGASLSDLCCPCVVVALGALATGEEQGAGSSSA